MNANLAAVLYLVAGVLFILSLRGPVEPGDIAAGQLLRHDRHGASRWRPRWRRIRRPTASAGCSSSSASPSAAAIGAVIARRVPMTSMPELVAAFHSLVGMAAVLVAAGAFYAPEAFDIGTPGHIHRRQPGRNVARRRHRRADLHRLGDRVRKTVGAHERRADHPAGAPHHQHRAGARAGGLHRRPGACPAARSTSG